MVSSGAEFEVEMLRREAQVLRSLHHPRVPQCLDFLLDETQCALVLPLYEGGDLLEAMLKKPDHRFDEKTSAQITFDLCSILNHLHRGGIVHRYE